jgi:hypothetical protein
MDSALLTTIVSTGGAVITGVCGMFVTANQLGKRVDDLRISVNRDMDSLRADFKELRSEFYTFKEVVNGKFAALDLEIAKLMDRQNPH